jgi:hypothetical protein
MSRKYLIYSLILLITAQALNFVLQSHKLQNKVFAETQEREEEPEDEANKDDDEEDEHDEDSNEYYETTKNNLNTFEVQTTKPTVTYTSEIALGYDIDTDGDKLVDAIDPDPRIPQTEFFTDDDNDKVANAFDKYKGEDDLKYIDFEDKNNNGIMDSLEE